MSGELGFYDTVVGNMGDRNDLNLWWEGGSLVERVASVCSNTIVVVHSVGPVYMTWSNHPNITSIIYAGAPGEQTGPAIVDVLYGAYNPSGRLPFSIADVRVFFFGSGSESREINMVLPHRTKRRMARQSYIIVWDSRT